MLCRNQVRLYSTESSSAHTDYVTSGNLFATFRHILIPMLLPAIVGAWTIFFIFAFREKILLSMWATECVHLQRWAN